MLHATDLQEAVEQRDRVISWKKCIVTTMYLFIITQTLSIIEWHFRATANENFMANEVPNSNLISVLSWQSPVLEIY